MSHIVIATTYLLVTFSFAMIGIWLRYIIPASHFAKDSKDSIMVGVGLIATMSALVLGLITASAKNSFDSVDSAIKQSSAQILTLDRVLARYGVITNDIRSEIKTALQSRMAAIWPEDAKSSVELDPMKSKLGFHAEEIGNLIAQLKPENDNQKILQAKASELAESILQGRWLIFAGSAPSVSIPFVLILLFWLAITFLCFGLFAPKNGTVIVVFFICSLSVASAIFLILELDAPFTGIIKVSPASMRYVLSHLNH